MLSGSPRRARLALGLLSLLGAAAALSPSPSLAAPSAEETRALRYLRAGVLAPRKISYIGEVETIRFGARRSEASIVRIEHRSPDYTRRSYLAPPALFGDSVVSRGDATFEFDEHRRRVTQGRRPIVDDGDRDDRFSLIARNYRAVESGRASIAGRSARIVTLINRATGRRMLAVWLDEGTNLPLEREKYRTDGSIAYRMRFTSIRYRDNLPIELFAADAPAGYRIADEPLPQLPLHATRAGVTEDRPAPDRVPVADGLSLIGETRSRIGGVAVRHELYSDGIRTLSLFIGPIDERPTFAERRARPVKIGAVQATYLEDANDGILTWDARNSSFTLVGDGSQDDLVRFAGEYERKQ